MENEASLAKRLEYRLDSSEVFELSGMAKKAARENDRQFFINARENFPWLTEELANNEISDNKLKRLYGLLMLGYFASAIVWNNWVPKEAAGDSNLLFLTACTLAIFIVGGKSLPRSPIEAAYRENVGPLRGNPEHSEEKLSLLLGNRS